MTWTTPAFINSHSIWPRKSNPSWNTPVKSKSRSFAKQGPSELPVSHIHVLCVGDVVGRIGREALRDHLTSLQREYDIHFTIVNVENSAGGFGITPKVYAELSQLNIQVMTSGNHIYDKKESIESFPDYTKLIRPLNYPPHCPGTGIKICQFNDIKIAVANLMGRVFMNPIDCPFQRIGT